MFINFAKQEGDVWKVNVEFKEKTGAIEMPNTAIYFRYNERGSKGI
jgi:hypothetical protein